MADFLDRFIPDTHLVLGTDFSEGASVALLEARRLSSWMKAKLQVVHVLEHGEESWQSSPASCDWVTRHELTDSDIVVLRGQPAVALVRYASAINALLLVMGSHGRSGYQALRLGSVAERVATIADCPVLVINPREWESTAGAIRRFAHRQRSGAWRP